ncbi:unnamed protein product [Medioppia subpectinata]|uniref:Uncharacterized protein n=1 Tax=Medioppia subpectinata TaxID=1979941 RepID=A0A7R9L5Y2_9ACAR|nr:unnamed protein product [Medioppia subpectinata]CAG2115971.1 unnamed protein product [Medioppia subpectinata]
MSSSDSDISSDLITDPEVMDALSATKRTAHTEPPPMSAIAGHTSQPLTNVSDTSSDENSGHEEYDSRPTQAVNRETAGRKSGHRRVNISDTSSDENSGQESADSRPKVTADGVHQDSYYA